MDESRYSFSAFRTLVAVSEREVSERRRLQDRLLLRCLRECGEEEAQACLFSGYTYWKGQERMDEAYRCLALLGLIGEGSCIRYHSHFPGGVLDEGQDPLLALLVCKTLRRGLQTDPGSPSWLDFELELLANEAEAYLRLGNRFQARERANLTVRYRRFARTSFSRWDHILTSYVPDEEDVVWERLRWLLERERKSPAFPGPMPPPLF